MATQTLIGPTPSGGTKAVIIFKDKDNRPCERQDAVSADVQEQDDEGNVIAHHMVDLQDGEVEQDPNAPADPNAPPGAAAPPANPAAPGAPANPADPKSAKGQQPPGKGSQPPAKSPQKAPKGSNGQPPRQAPGEGDNPDAPPSARKKGKVTTLPPATAPAEEDDPAEKARLMAEIMAGVLDEETLRRLADGDEDLEV